MGREPRPLHDLRFRRLLGERAWAKLPAAVRVRFSTRLAAGDSKVYRGRLVETRLSPLGWGLAHLLRIIGAPLPLDTDTSGAAAVVTVTEDEGGAGQFWTRQYNRRRSFPQVIHSRKTFAGPTGLMEEVGGGVLMLVDLAVRQNRLCFISTGYRLRLLGAEIPLPAFLTPGQMRIEHEDLGHGRFAFDLTVTHPVFGELCHQRAEFRDTPTH
ncbi:MAG: DUF4166 domain-containing protein [Pseudomonadota bacterium]